MIYYPNLSHEAAVQANFDIGYVMVCITPIYFVSAMVGQSCSERTHGDHIQFRGSLSA